MSFKKHSNYLKIWKKADKSSRLNDNDSASVGTPKFDLRVFLRQVSRLSDKAFPT